MAGSIRIEMNRAGIIAALQAPGVRAELLRRGNAASAAAGPGHMVTAHTGATRVRVSVITATPSAMRREAVDRSLTRALDAARR
jgi:hypothetical protein